MPQSQPFEQSTDPTVDVESFVLYRSPQGDCYHMRSRCAADADIPPALDAANSLLDDVEMYRAEGIEQELSDENLCSICATKLRRVLGFEIRD